MDTKQAPPSAVCKQRPSNPGGVIPAESRCLRPGEPMVFRSKFDDARARMPVPKARSRWVSQFQQREQIPCPLPGSSLRPSVAGRRPPSSRRVVSYSGHWFGCSSRPETLRHTQACFPSSPGIPSPRRLTRNQPSRGLLCRGYRHQRARDPEPHGGGQKGQ